MLHYFATIILAAERGDYCHGNGADWQYVDRLRGTLCHVNTVTGRTSSVSVTDPRAADYLAATPARRDATVAASLRDHVLATYGVTVDQYGTVA